jgi:hypothetical protein
MLMAVRFAHTLLFACPDCQRDISVSRLSDYSNPEIVETLTFRLQCLSCQKIVDLSGYLAKTHSVKEWNGIARE